MNSDFWHGREHEGSGAITRGLQNPPGGFDIFSQEPPLDPVAFTVATPERAKVIQKNQLADYLRCEFWWCLRWPCRRVLMASLVRWC